MPFQLIRTTLASSLATAGTLAFTYPTGTSKGDYTTYEAALVTDGNDVFTTSGKDFTIALGDTSATITWKSTTTLAQGTGVTLQLNEKGIQGFEAKKNKELLDWVFLKKSREMKQIRVNLGNAVTASAVSILGAQSVGATAVTFVATAANIVSATYDFTNGMPIPRNITVTGSSASDQVINVRGRDAYGNQMSESLTLSGTTLIKGAKAFKWFDGYTIAAGGSTSKTFTMGYGDKLGLPFFLGQWNQIAEQYVDGELIATNAKVRIHYQVPIVAANAGTSVWVVSPVYGFIGKMTNVVTAAFTTGGTVSVKIATVAVVGLSTAIDTSAAGTVFTDTSTAEFGATGEIGKDLAIEIVGDAAFDSVGNYDGFIEITPGGLVVVGDPLVGTATTGDVRGTWTPPTAVTNNGSRVYELVINTYDPQYLGLNQFYV